VSSPSFLFEDYADIVGSYVARGDIPHSQEGFARPIGSFWTPNSIDNSTRERCHARKAYYDPVQKRPNLHLLPNTHVDEIIFKKGNKLAANGVKITSNTDSKKASVYAKKEVIMAAGSVFTPHLLMLSGIGPKDVLSAANVKVKKDLPAVGSNFQDHPALYMTFELSNQTVPNLDMLLGPTPDPEYGARVAEEYYANRTGPYTTTRGNALLFMPLKYFSNKYKEITALFMEQNATDYLPESYSKNKALLKGFLKQRDILKKLYLSEDSAAGECTISPSGQTATAMQKPLSRGALTLNTTHPTANPIVVRNAFQNPVDMMVLAELTRWNRAHWTKSPVLQRYAPVELVPGPQYQTDAEIMDAGIKSGALNPTFAHPSGACPMMPEELGGCVDSKLRVYGVENLRIVDASIMPLIPAAHLQATVYAVAEKAADIIKGR
jgi:choline dehydrogenase-like flavoprotein